ncbi:hypothetical protein EMCRGX_G031092 [Ephydatia muelleri]|eukprot:Em0018g906a
MISPSEIERNELGYRLEEVRGKHLRLVKRANPISDWSVFMVHGGGGRAGQFKHLIKVLEPNMTIVAVDFLGHGDSPAPNRPELYTADEHLSDLTVIYNSHRRLHNVFISHCYGAIHTLRLLDTLKQEQRLTEVAGVILLDVGIRALSLGMLSSLPAFLLEYLRPLARSFSNAAIFPPTTDPALIQFENTITSNNRMYMMKVLAQDCGNQELWGRGLACGKAAMEGIPGALLCGEEDGLFSVQSCRETAQYLGVASERFHVVQGAGHLPMLDHPEEVIRIVSEFLSSLQGAQQNTS